MRIEYRLYLIVLPILLQVGCYSGPVKSIDSRPNVIVILVDEMRWDEYTAAGNKYIKTPHVDRMAKEGITFKNSFCTTPLCSPSRASFLTGQYAHKNGIIDKIRCGVWLDAPVIEKIKDGKNIRSRVQLGNTKNLYR